MPQYKKRSSTSRNSKTSADWQGLAYYSIIGVLCYVGFMAIRSLSLGTGNKSSFLDWFKSIFNILQSGTGSGAGSPGEFLPDEQNAGFETDVDGTDTGTDLYSGTIKDFEYFKASEYFGNYARPTNPVYISNYNSLMKDLDLIRKNFGSAIKIVAGYKAGDLAMFQECKGVHIKSSIGDNQALNKVVIALKKSLKISGSIVYMEDTGETRYYHK